MEKLNTKFWCFTQNNVGGYFVQDEEKGVAEFVIIEAQNEHEALDRFHDISIGVNGFWNQEYSFPERWDIKLENSTKFPSIMKIHVEDFPITRHRDHCYIHYYGGTIEEYVFGEGYKIKKA